MTTTNNKPTGERKDELRECPWCKAIPQPCGHYFEVFHLPECFFAEIESSNTRTIITRKQVERWNTRPAQPVDRELPLCPVHNLLEAAHRLEVPVGCLNCVACSLNERQELLDILAPCAPADNAQDSVTVLREVVGFWLTHHGDNRVVVSYPAAAPLPVEVLLCPDGTPTCRIHGPRYETYCTICAPASVLPVDGKSLESIMRDLESRNSEIANLQPAARYDILCALETAAKAVKPVSTSGDQVEGNAAANETLTASKRVKVEGATAGETALSVDTQGAATLSYSHCAVHDQRAPCSECEGKT